MTRTVVNFGLIGTSTFIQLERNDGGFVDPDARTIRIRALTGVDARARGQELMRLLHRHEPVKRAVRGALDMARGSGTRPLYFHVEAHTADELPWELLYGDEQGIGFCALDSRWPIGRVARQFARVEPRGYVDHITIVAVLSAAGRSGMAQLQSLLDGVRSTGGTAVGARLHVISGQKTVLDAASAAAAAGAPVTVEEIAGNGAAVAKQIGDARPTMVHLLCHGAVVQGIRTLYLATAGDFVAGQDRGEAAMKIEMLTEAIAPCNPWLVMLAACGTADADDGPALAHELVNQGVPAAIGMRRLVDIGATDRFCQAFYSCAMTALATTLAPGDRSVRELDWAATVTAARQEVSGTDPVHQDTWSDPVLYVQTDTLSVFRPTPHGMSLSAYTALRGELDTLHAYRAKLDPNTEPAVLAAIDARIAELEAQLAAAQQ